MSHLQFGNRTVCDRQTYSAEFAFNIFNRFFFINIENDDSYMYGVTNGNKICNDFWLIPEYLLTDKIQNVP